MPSKSKAQERFMQAAAHSPQFAAKAHISQDVAREFEAADKAKGKLPERKSAKKMIETRYLE